MNYGLYLSAAGALANSFRQDLYANNLANADTVGFKPDIAQLRQRLPERIESPGATNADPRWMLERLGGGTFGHTTRVSLTQGDLRATEGKLDVAISGEGFFAVTPPGGDAASPYLTRDGRFTLDAAGRLVMSTSGMTVLDTEGESITLDRSAPVSINRQGELRQDGALVAQLRVTQPADTAALRKVGHNLLRAADGVALVDAPGIVNQGQVESSATDPIQALTAMIDATKSLQANASLMQYHDQLMGQTINTFGRVA